ncbi:MAG: HD domain-containing protein [Acidilobus sp.]
MRLSDIIIALNSLSRTGWMLRGVPSSVAESVSQHSFAAALIAADVASQLGLDPLRAAFIALVHDIGESIVGDVSKSSGVDRTAKELAEREAIFKMNVSDVVRGAALEYIEGRSLESIVAKVGDLASTILEGCYYKSLGFKVSEIVTSSVNELRAVVQRLPNGQKVLDVLRSEGIDLTC